MHLAYRFLVAAMALAGCLSLVLSGELNLLFLLPGLAILPGYYRYLRGLPPANRWVIAGLAVAELLVVAFDTLMVSGDFFIAVAHMTIIFQALKSFDLREPWDPLQVYFMALLQLVITSELTLSIVMGAVFVVFLFIFMAAMVFSHFMKEGTLEMVRFKRPLIIISLVAFVATNVFFIAIPRVRGGMWGRKTSGAIKSVGFTENVDLGSFGDVLENPAIVMRVEIAGRRLPLYWRGLTLDYFDGSSWKDTERGRSLLAYNRGKALVRPIREEEATLQKVIIEPLDTDVVFGLGEIVGLETQSWRVERDDSGSVFLPAKNYRRFSYTVISAPDGGRPVGDTGKYLQLTGGMEGVAALAREVAGRQGGPMTMAGRIESFLKENYEYSLKTSPPPPGMTPVEDFLFSSKRGFCEHYSTAMVLMLRSLGIPARMVTGFKGGRTNSYGNYVIVRQANAHSWVEAAIDGEWSRFDPTPVAGEERGSLLVMTFDALRMSWYRYVVGFSSRDQMRILRSFSSPVLTMPELRGIRSAVRPVHIILPASALAALLVLFFLKGVGFGRHSFETRVYLRFRNRLRRKGGRTGPAATSRDVAREARRLSLDGERVSEFIRMYEEARFGGKGMDAEKKRTYKGLIKR